MRPSSASTQRLSCQESHNKPESLALGPGTGGSVPANSRSSDPRQQLTLFFLQLALVEQIVSLPGVSCSAL